MSTTDIKAGLSAEMAEIQTFAAFNIIKSTTTPKGLQLEVLGKAILGADTATALSDDFLDAGACWFSPAKGTAIVTQVDPENNTLKLGNLKGPPPQVGCDVLLYPPNYVRQVLKCWDDDALAKEANACLDDLHNPKRITSAPIKTIRHPYLRHAQRHASTLVQFTSSYLLGPPGTGKTTTIAVVVAEFLAANPAVNVLLVSTTNLAVDQALIAIDEALQSVDETLIRYQLRRVGHGYDRRRYVGREHLLPRGQEQVATDKDSSSDEYNGSDAVSVQNCNGDKHLRLHAMTITSLIARMKTMRALPKFDLVVFDEASQINLAQTLLVMTLGKARLFAGDPEQLSPIAKSPARSAQRWLTQSAFAHQPVTGASVCLLDEQSRMAGPICNVVSEIFYSGALRVASDALADPNWLKSRSRNMGHIAADEHVTIQRMATNATRSMQRKGWFREESADATIHLILSALSEGHVTPTEIKVITPYRLQHAFLREQLDMQELHGVSVGTVHSIQGSQSPFVIFDPVRGCDDFLQNRTGRQLINVAISRAQAKLIVMLSDQDLENPVFAQMRSIAARDTHIRSSY